MLKEKVEFTQLSNSETKFKYGEYTFILRQQDRGFFGAGRSVSLYQLNGVKKDFIVGVGWLKPDSQPSFRDDLIKHIATMDEIKKAAIEYVEKLLS